MSGTVREWGRTVLVFAACLFLYFYGVHVGQQQSVTFQHFCEQMGGTMESANHCVVPASEAPPPRTLGA